MSEFRHDWFSDRWVIFAPQRSKRPNEFSDSVSQNSIRDSGCPFCEGNEGETPPPVLVLPAPVANEDSRDWQVRVVPNKFPVVQWDGSCLLAKPETVGFSKALSRHSQKSQSSSAAIKESPNRELQTNQVSQSSIDSTLYGSQPLEGAHEVIIESNDHLTSVSQLSNAQFELVLEAYQTRLQFWRESQSMQYAVIFKNSGAEAGATLSHAHSQLIATSVVPSEVKRAAERWIRFHSDHKQCPVCEVIRKERREESRVVWETERFIAFCPYASRLPYSVWIAPKGHQGAFESISSSERQELAAAFRRTLEALEQAVSEAAYNFVVQTSPLLESSELNFHWRIELFPRLSKQAGFEWGTDCFINPILPEEAARTLRLFFNTT